MLDVLRFCSVGLKFKTYNFGFNGLSRFEY